MVTGTLVWCNAFALVANLESIALSVSVFPFRAGKVFSKHNYKHTNTHVHTHLHTCKRTCTDPHACACTHVWGFMQKVSCMPFESYTCIQMLMHTYTHTRVCADTHRARGAEAALDAGKADAGEVHVPAGSGTLQPLLPGPTVGPRQRRGAGGGAALCKHTTQRHSVR